jgi:hypothetical protein
MCGGGAHENDCNKACITQTQPNVFAAAGLYHLPALSQRRCRPPVPTTKWHCWRRCSSACGVQERHPTAVRYVLELALQVDIDVLVLRILGPFKVRCHAIT